jgi:hypothetical protein
MRFLGLASVVAVLAIAGVSAASTLRNRSPSEATSEGTVVPEPRPSSKTSTPKPAAPKAETVVQQSAAVTTPPATEASAPTPAPATAPPTSTPRAGFVLVEGRSQLSDSVVATRAGDSVIVNFDAYGYRTRRASKFESSLRETLPLIYGKGATASMDTMTGEIVTNHDVIGALARDGMRYTLDNGLGIRIKVLTRVVSDGPIAIGYLTTIER